MQNGVGLGGRTWGGGDHCMNSRRYRKNSSLRSPGLQVSETGRVVEVALDAVVGEKSMQGWTQMWRSNYKRRAEAARKEEFI